MNLGYLQTKIQPQSNTVKCIFSDPSKVCRSLWIRRELKSQHKNIDIPRNIECNYEIF